MNIVDLPINDVVILRDDDNEPILALTEISFDTVEAFLIETPATVAAVDVEELAGVGYRFVFTPTIAGDWALHVVYGEGTIFDFRETLRRYEVVSVAVGNPYAYLSGFNVSIVSPVLPTGDIELYQGDDYDDDEARALSWMITGASDLTGADVKLLINQGANEMEVEGIVVESGGETQTVTAELSAAETATLVRAPVPLYKLWATLPNGHVQTLKRGRILVTDDLTPDTTEGP